MKDNFRIFGKSLFFPDDGILVIGDLQLGYEEQLFNSGMAFPLNQLEQSINDFQKIIDKLREDNLVLKNIVLLGDLKHHFGYNKSESKAVREFLSFLERFLPGGGIILIRGNHEKFLIDNRDYKDYYLTNSGILFLHGHKWFDSIDKKLLSKVKSVVIAHLHPAIMISDSAGVKKEKFKCFLIGEFLNKGWFIIPSFFPLIEGSCINNYPVKNPSKEFSVIPRAKLQSFSVFVPSDDKVLNFGKLRKIN